MAHMRISGHRLHGERVTYRSSPNHGDLFTPPNPDTVIIHYTACPDAASAIATLCDPERRVSAHVVVGRQGDVTQLVPFDRVAWHAGVSRWGERESLNQYSLGIEIDNAGQLKLEEGRLVAWFGQQYPQDEVIQAVHRHQTQLTSWHRYTDTQTGVVMQLCRLLMDAYGIRHILGHDEIAPMRKVDPGPAFPLDAMRGQLLGQALPALSPEAARRRTVS